MRMLYWYSKQALPNTMEMIRRAKGNIGIIAVIRRDKWNNAQAGLKRRVSEYHTAKQGVYNDALGDAARPDAARDVLSQANNASMCRHLFMV